MTHGHTSDKAQSRLKTITSILQIGRDCGFNDPDNLKRLFKKRYGVSMREWRRKTARPAT